MSEHKRGELSEEYAAEVEKLESDAKGRKKRKPKSVPQLIGEQNKHDKETDAIRAKAAGTNRQYLRDIRKIRAEQVSNHLRPSIPVCRNDRRVPVTDAGIVA